MKTIKKSVLFMLFCLTTMTPLFSQTINVSTGINNLGNSIAIGAVDPNWVISAGPGGPTTRRVTSFAGYWQPTPVAITNAGWINYTGTYTDPIGIETFERPFTVAAGSGSFTTNFGVAWDDVLVSLELIPPVGGGSPIPLTVPPAAAYQVSPMINYTVDCPKDGVWKIRAKVQFIDQLGAFILSGYVNINPAPQICDCDDLAPNFSYSTNGNCVTTLVAAIPQNFFYSVQYNWKVNGVPVGTGQVFNYSFPGNGTYTVCLTVTATLADGTICEKEFCKDIIIQCDPCSCDQLLINYAYNIDRCHGHFSGLVDIPSCMQIIGYEWYVDGTLISSAQVFDYTFLGNGTYKICLIVKAILPDGTICEKEVCKIIDVKDCDGCNCDNLNATFSTLIDRCFIHLEATPQVPACMQNLNYNWYVDGNPIGSGQVIDYIVTGGGLHLICLELTATLPDGTLCQRTICKEVEFKDCDQATPKSGSIEIEESLLLYPNPASSEINVDFKTTQAGTILVTLKTINGQEIIHESRATEAGMQHFKLIIPTNVVDQILFVEITNGELKINRKVSISKH